MGSKLDDLLGQLQGFEELMKNKESLGDDDLISEIGRTLNNFNGDGRIKVGITLLCENAVVPKYAKFGDAGTDYTITSIIEETIDNITYGFGVAIEVPKGYVGLLFPRSSIRGTNLSLTNCVGVIDSSYRGEVMATFRKHFTKEFHGHPYKVNERGAQMIILPYPEIEYVVKDELSETDRGSGGYGSTN